MKTLISFLISESQRIHITINEENKVNTYGYETNGLHIFDEVEVEYIQDGNKIVLASDIIRYLVEKLDRALEKLLKNELFLDRSLGVGKVGYFFSKKKHTIDDEAHTSKKEHDIFPQYWVWSSPTNIQTWFYSVDSKNYLEISPTYPWLFSDHCPEETHISFNEYIKNYKPILIVELQESLVKQWIQQCQGLLHKLEKCV